MLKQMQHATSRLFTTRMLKHIFNKKKLLFTEYLSPDFEEAAYAVLDSNLSSKIHLSCYYITILYRLNSEEFL